MARVLVAGCGYVGCALAARLAGEGHRVWGMRRRPAAFPPGVQPMMADLADRATLRSLPPDLDFAVYTAAAAGSTSEAYRAAYVDGVRNLVDAPREQGQQPRRLLFTSSTAVYGQSDGEWVDEDSPTEPRGFAGERMLEAERLVLSAPFPATVLRLGGIYGPGRSRWLDRVRRGEAECPPHPVFTNRIHRDDCAGALRHLMLLDAPEPLYLGVDRDPAELCGVLRWLADRLGVAPPIRAAGEERARGSKRCSSERLVRSGYVFRYPTFREGFEALLAP